MEVSFSKNSESSPIFSKRPACNAPDAIISPTGCSHTLRNSTVVASVGKESGYVPYTAYSVKKSYLETHKELLEAFTRAIEKGQEYVNTHTPEQIAKVIAPQFKDTDRKTLEKIVERYAEQDSYKENTKFEKESFTLIQDILEEAGELEKRVDYETLVTTEFSE